MTDNNKYYSLSWDSYQTGICKGFAEQQNKQEFVDMTLVAEGHLVKVHKNLICLASSFIKQMIKSAPCEHPIIFLNNVSHETLCYLLEYIYTGEVKVGEDKLQAVLKVANELKLCGLEQLSKRRPTPPASVAQQASGNTAINNSYTTGVSSQVFPVLRNGTGNMVSNENICQYTNGYQLEQMSQDCYDHSLALDTSSPALAPENGIYFTHNVSTAAMVQPGSAEPIATSEETDTLRVTNITIDTTGSLMQQYSITQRGSPQLLLNRFVYNLHHQAQCGQRRRWRCVDYRRLRCAAYVDTLQDQITARKNIHHHEYHDNIILNKVKEKQVFGSLTAATCAPGDRRGPAAREIDDVTHGAASGDES